MARNLKIANLKKLKGIEVKGFTIDLANYIYNPSYDNEYPHLRKVIQETETERVYCDYYYFKYYNGGGEYFKRLLTFPINNGEIWGVAKKSTETSLGEANRFSMANLIKLVDTMEV